VDFRDADEDAMRSRCLEDTKAASNQCSKAENGELDAATAQLLPPCVNAVDDLAAEGDCGVFVGSLEERTLAAPPATCVAQGTDALPVLNAAQAATAETSGELCQRLAESFCRQTEECILADYGGELPEDLTNSLGTPYDRCIAELSSSFTATCSQSDVYAMSESITPNPTREAAFECLGGLTAGTCDGFMSVDTDPICTLAFVDAKTAQAFFTQVFDIVSSYASGS